MGTELEARGVDTRLPRWSATALLDAPEEVAAVHASYARAGASVHTTNTFRARERTLGQAWQRAASDAVQIARRSVPSTHRIAGSIAPLEDCYRPDLSPPDCRKEHRSLAQLLAGEGCDLLLVETFAHVGEAWVAIEEAALTGLPTWASFTPGPRGELMSPDAVYRGAVGAVERGASVVMVNCISGDKAIDYLPSLAASGAAQYGVYANAGCIDDAIGWQADHAIGAQRYTQWATAWMEAGATLLGGCCGTGPRHIEALSQHLKCYARAEE